MHTEEQNALPQDWTGEGMRSYPGQDDEPGIVGHVSAMKDAALLPNVLDELAHEGLRRYHPESLREIADTLAKYQALRSHILDAAEALEQHDKLSRGDKADRTYAETKRAEAVAAMRNATVAADTATRATERLLRRAQKPVTTFHVEQPPTDTWRQDVAEDARQRAHAIDPPKPGMAADSWEDYVQ